MRIHSSKEPSWLPQDAAMRYASGKAVFELRATLMTEKSFITKAATRHR